MSVGFLGQRADVMHLCPHEWRHRCATRRRRDAATHWAYASEPDEDNPARQLRLGFDTTGRMLEIVVLHFDSGNELIIHAMKERSTYLDLLD